jgi:hypothetical protein
MRAPSFAVALVAAAASGVSGHPFANNACKLITPAQIAKIPGVAANCTKTAPAPALGATLYQGNWPGKTRTSSRLQLVVAVYTDKNALALAKRNLDQGLPGTPAHKLTGIGDGAYEGTGENAVGVNFAVGKYVAYLTLTAAVGSHPPPPGTLVPLAKSITASLR